MSRKVKPADTTTRITREEIEAHARAARAARFVWPAPPYYEFTGTGSQSSECLVVYRDGRKATGTLEEFLPDESQFGFRATDATQPLRIAFSSILRLQLVQPVALRSQAVRIDDTEQLFAPSDRQPFSLDPANGKEARGETVGAVHAVCGLFLFPPERDGRVTRWFVPAETAAASSIGKPLGEMLVDEKLASPEVVSAAISSAFNALRASPSARRARWFNAASSA